MNRNGCSSSIGIGVQHGPEYAVISGVELPPELIEIWSLFRHRSLIDGISMEGMAERFKNFEKDLPKLDSLTDEQLVAVRKSKYQHREKVKSLL